MTGYGVIAPCVSLVLGNHSCIEEKVSKTEDEKNYLAKKGETNVEPYG